MPPIAPIAELLAMTDSATPPADFAAVAPAIAADAGGAAAVSAAPTAVTNAAPGAVRASVPPKRCSISGADLRPRPRQPLLHGILGDAEEIGDVFRGAAFAVVEDDYFARFLRQVRDDLPSTRRSSSRRSESAGVGRASTAAARASSSLRSRA